MNKLFSVHSLENKGFYIPSVDSQLLPESDIFMSLFNFFISTGNRDSYSEGVKKIILGLLFRTFGHILESQSTQKTSIQTSCPTQSSVSANALVALK